ncbi:MAG: hypothetical protein ACFFA0_07475 [Promethearchaeota archaeon]
MAKKNGYILSFIAGIIGLISLITPIAYHEDAFSESYIWMWGLYTLKILAGSTEINFSEDSDYLTWAMISTLLIVLATIILINTANKARRRKSDYSSIWIVCGIMLIAAPIVYYFGLSEEIPTWLTDLFWDYYDFHFAFFGPIIAGVLAILGGCIN